MDMADDQIHEIEVKKQECNKIQRKISELWSKLGRKDDVIKILIKYDTLKFEMQRRDLYFVEICVDSFSSFWRVKEKGQLIYSLQNTSPTDAPRWMTQRQA